ncbi:VOC family protein [Candidatus Uabimicrobium sp. HlEnr_7]|uniref:VOC family protein n=1 Tax=Candidatus Uabimicrobium helgolandensis TaxID=3095367 RepID=UPI0035585704
MIKSINLIVIKTPDIKKTKAFYELLGLSFEQEKHGSGPIHFSCAIQQCIFEIYPTNKTGCHTTRLGFSASSIDSLTEKINKAGYQIVKKPKKTE